jgi:hypothetical protein
MNQNTPEPAEPRGVEYVEITASSSAYDRRLTDAGDVSAMQRALEQMSSGATEAADRLREATHQALVESAAGGLGVARATAAAFAADGNRHVVWDVVGGHFVPREVRELSPLDQLRLDQAARDFKAGA